MNQHSMTRRHWIAAGLATCGYLAAVQSHTLADPGTLYRRLAGTVSQSTR